MKRFALIATLILLIGTARVVFADNNGPEGDQFQGGNPRPEQPHDPAIAEPQDGNDNESGTEQEQEDAPKPQDVNASEDNNQPEDHGGFFSRLFRHDQAPAPLPGSQREDNKGFLDSLKQQRDDLQQQRQDEFGNLKQDRAALEAALKAQRDAFKAEVDKVKQEKPTVRKEFVETHFTEAITNLHAVDDRIKAKITELSGKGFDMTAATTALTAAEASLKSAEDQIAALKAMTVTDTSATSVTKPHDAAKKIEATLKDVRDNFHAAIQAMKAAIGIPEDDSASQPAPAPTTPTTPPTTSQQ